MTVTMRDFTVYWDQYMNRHQVFFRLCIISLAGYLLTACGTTSAPESPSPTHVPESTETAVLGTPDTISTPQQSPVATQESNPVATTTSSTTSQEPSSTGQTTFPHYSDIDVHEFDQDNNDALSPSELQAAVEELYPLYVWPDDYWLSMESIRDGVPTEMMGDPVTFEPTYVYTTVDFPFGCAWMSQYVSDLEQGDTASADQSFAIVREWVNNSPVWVKYDRDRWQGWLDDAELGDPGFIRQFVNQSCSGFPFEKKPTTATDRS